MTDVASRIGARWALRAGLGALLLAVQPAAAQDPPPTVEELIVPGMRPESRREIVARFVSAASVETGTGQVGRWDKDICLSVDGLQPQYADAIQHRIATEAAALGLVVGKQGCKPNIVVVATDNAQTLLKYAVEKNQRAFLDDEWALRVGKGELQKFIASDQPVRWWFVVKRVTRDGQPYEVRKATEVRGSGKIRSTVRADFSHAFIVLDVTRIRTVRFSALADYIAMVSLAQTDPDAQLPNVPTILRLFRDRDEGLTPAESLTDWDRAFLKALYAARRDAKRVSIQEREMTRSMEEALAGGQTEP